MSGPESSRVSRQLRHDVDDVYEILSAVAGTQQEHTAQLSAIEQVLHQQAGRLDRLDGRLGGIENTQQQILELLRGRQEEGTANR